MVSFERVNLAVREGQKAQQEQASKADAAASEATFQFDPVAVEIQRWEYLAPDEVMRYVSTTPA